MLKINLNSRYKLMASETNSHKQDVPIKENPQHIEYAEGLAEKECYLAAAAIWPAIRPYTIISV